MTTPPETPPMHTAAVPDWARQATEPTSLEVQRLRARLVDVQPSRSPALGWAVAGVALAALLFAVWPAGYGTAPVGQEVALTEGPLQLGPSITLSGDGALRVLAADRDGTVVQLDRGTVVAEVDPEGRFRAFAVRAPGDVEVSVVGTRFSVSWDPRSGGEVQVTRGRVAVTAPDGPRALGAGESWSWVGDAAVEEEPLERPVPGADDGAPGLLDGGDRLSAPDALPSSGVPRAGSQAADPSPVPPAAARPPPPVAAAGPDAAEPEPIAALDPIDSAPVPAPDLSQARDFGRVQEAMERGAYEDAAALAARFRSTHPRGALSDEAGVIEIEALASTDPATAVRAAEAWLAEHPSHTRRADVLQLHAATANDRLQDCAAAVPSYDELTRLVSGADQARALAFLGLCAHQLGDAARARAAIDAALAHPDLPPPLAPSLKKARRALSSETPR